jgi:hypothetical protein
LATKHGTSPKVFPAFAVMGRLALTAEDHLGQNLFAADLTVDTVHKWRVLDADKLNSLGTHQHRLVVDSQGPPDKLLHPLQIVAADLFANQQRVSLPSDFDIANVWWLFQLLDFPTERFAQYLATPINIVREDLEIAIKDVTRVLQCREPPEGRTGTGTLSGKDMQCPIRFGPCKPDIRAVSHAMLSSRPDHNGGIPIPKDQLRSPQPSSRNSSSIKSICQLLPHRLPDSSRHDMRQQSQEEPDGQDQKEERGGKAHDPGLDGMSP